MSFCLSLTRLGCSTKLGIGCLLVFLCCSCAREDTTLGIGSLHAFLYDSCASRREGVRLTFWLVAAGYMVGWIIGCFPLGGCMYDGCMCASRLEAICVLSCSPPDCYDSIPRLDLFSYCFQPRSKIRVAIMHGHMHTVVPPPPGVSPEKNR